MRSIGSVLMVLMMVCLLFVGSASALVNNNHNKCGDTYNHYDYDWSSTAKATANAYVNNDISVSPKITNNFNPNVRNDVRNNNANLSYNENNSKANNEGVSNTTTVYGDTFKYPVQSAVPLELPYLPQLPDSTFNPSADGFAINTFYTTMQLKENVDSAKIMWVRNKVTTVMPFVGVAESNAVEIGSGCVTALNEVITTQNGQKFALYTYNGKKYALLGAVTSTAKQAVPESVVVQLTAFRVAERGATLLFIDKIGANIGGKSVGFNLFGTGVKVGADSAVSGGGGIGPSYVSRYYEVGVIGRAFMQI